MLQSGMEEAQQNTIKVEVVSKEDFDIFYGLLGPGAWGNDRVTEATVDVLLVIADYYQVDFIKSACEDCLLNLAVSGERLLQAHKHGLKTQYQRCVQSLAKEGVPEDLRVLHLHAPEIMLEVAMEMQSYMAGIRKWEGKIQRCVDMLQKQQPQYAVHKVNGEVFHCVVPSEKSRLERMRNQQVHELTSVLELMR